MSTVQLLHSERRPDVSPSDLGTPGTGLETRILNALPHPVIVIDAEGLFVFANSDAEQFFSAGFSYLAKRKLNDFIAADSPLFGLIDQVRAERSRISEYRVDVSSPRLGSDRMVDLYVSGLPDRPDHVVVMIQLRSIA